MLKWHSWIKLMDKIITYAVLYLLLLYHNDRPLVGCCLISNMLIRNIQSFAFVVYFLDGKKVQHWRYTEDDVKL